MKPAMNTTEVKFTYEGIAVTFESVHSEDHILRAIRDSGTFYERAGSSYWIVDCLGWSPTYIIEPTDVGGLRRGLVNGAWVLRTMLPASWKGARGYVRRLGQVLSAGWWDLSRVKA